MGGSDTAIAAAALAIAVFALFSTIAQIVGQFLATADGLRRCQPSVMAGWAKNTRLRWRWREFRFEVLFSTPTIAIYEPAQPKLEIRSGRTFVVKDHKLLAQNAVPVLGTDESYRKTLISRYIERDISHELVCWIPFLQAVHIKAEEALTVIPAMKRKQMMERNGQIPGFPAIYSRERSWDFMPIDVVRPFASTTVSDVAILARRLGMRWTEFRPNDGIMRAEGSGHVITSISTRGVGIILQYTYVGDFDVPLEDDGSGNTLKVSESKENYSWMPEADAMGFGILPGNPSFDTPKIPTANEEEILAYMAKVDKKGDATSYLKSLMEANPGWTSAFADLIPMTTPMLRIYGTRRAHIPAPNAYTGGATREYISFKVYRYNLSNRRSESEQFARILNWYDKLHDQYGDLWENHEPDATHDREHNIPFLNDVQTAYDETTDFFLRLQDGTKEKPAPRLRYMDLVHSHLLHCVFYFNDARRILDSQPPDQRREHFGFHVDWIAEAAHVYWDNLPKVVADLKRQGCDDEQLVRDAWATLMFRAFCWHRCHHMVSGPTVPSRYYRSRQPVYIG